MKILVTLMFSLICVLGSGDIHAEPDTASIRTNDGAQMDGEWTGDGSEAVRATSLLGCLNSPAALAVCIEAGVISMGKVAARYTGKDKGKYLIKLLQKWGGKIKPGGNGSHTKMVMPNGRVEIVPQSPGKGTVADIIKRALEDVK